MVSKEEYKTRFVGSTKSRYGSTEGLCTKKKCLLSLLFGLIKKKVLISKTRLYF